MINSIGMNNELGKKWFVFYTKTRPYIVGLFTIIRGIDFVQHYDLYLSYWWLFLFFAVSITQFVLSLMVAVKSRDNYVDFVHFVKSVLLFETVGVAYNTSVNTYLSSDGDLMVAIACFLIYFLLFYFLWYRLNVKYFKKRMVTVSFSVPEVNSICETREFSNGDVIETITSNSRKISFCRKCGQKLSEDSRFCFKCGTKINQEY